MTLNGQDYVYGIWQYKEVDATNMLQIMLHLWEVKDKMKDFHSYVFRFINRRKSF